MTTDIQDLPVEVDLSESPENQQLFPRADSFPNGQPDPPLVSWVSFLDVDMLDDDPGIE